MPDLLPTFHCFDDALEYVVERVKRQPGLAHQRTLIVVHGIARGSSGELYAHAWVEEDGHCWDAAMMNGERIWYSVARDEFYAARQIQETTRYTIREAGLNNLRTYSYGPWEAKYRALCGRGDRVIVGRIEADASAVKVITWADER